MTLFTIDAIKIRTYPSGYDEAMRTRYFWIILTISFCLFYISNANGTNAMFRSRWSPCASKHFNGTLCSETCWIGRRQWLGESDHWHSRWYGQRFPSKWVFSFIFNLELKEKKIHPLENARAQPPFCANTKELSLTLDITEEIAVVSYEPDDEVKEKKNITLTTEVIPFYLEKLDAICADNGGHLALGRVCTKH